MSSGQAIEWTMSGDMGVITGDPSFSGMTMSATIKMEAPKMWMSASAMGQSYTMISDGANLYMYSPMMGEDWYMFSGADADVTVGTPQEIMEGIQDIPEGVTLNCQLLADIPDSQFQLPAGVTPIDIMDMMEGTGYGPSMYM
jgi:hypothetical protein